nr:unnamed protein product [Spirometra erinaceieuropaei]
MGTYQSSPGSTFCADADVEVTKDNQLIHLRHRRHEGGQVLIEFVPCSVETGHRGNVDTDDDGEFAFPERQVEAHQAIVDTPWQTGQLSYDVIPDVEGDTRVPSLCPGATVLEKTVVGTNLLLLALFGEAGLAGWDLITEMAMPASGAKSLRHRRKLAAPCGAPDGTSSQRNSRYRVRGHIAHSGILAWFSPPVEEVAGVWPLGRAQLREATSDRRFPSPGLHLQAAKCSPIPTFGSLSITLNIGLRRSFTWIFVIADVLHAILSSDFLAEFDLFVDCRRARLLDRTTGLSVRGLTPFTAPTNLSVLNTDIFSPFRALHLRHANIISPQFRSG